jgi:hypothetical protein
MEKNKIGKYFRYAIGEIVLIVVGILIALQINIWNESRKVQLFDKQLIRVLITDLNKKRLENSTDLYNGTKMIERSDPIINTWKKEKRIDTTDIKFILGELGEDGWFFTELSPTYISVANSSLWNRLPDSLIQEINHIYYDEFGSLKAQYAKSVEYATFCKLHYLTPYNLLESEYNSMELTRIVSKNPEEFISYLNLFRTGVITLNASMKSSITAIDRTIKNIEIYKESL